MKTQRWELNCGDPGNSVTYWCYSLPEVFEHCGKLLYANSLFDMRFLKVEQVEELEYHTEALNCYYDPEPGRKKPTWILQSISVKEEHSVQHLDHIHEVFGLIVGRLSLGARLVQVNHIDNAFHPKLKGDE